MQKVKRTWTARRRARARLGLLAGLATVALLAATACTPPAPEPGQRYRVPADFGEGILTAALDLTGPPAGANLESCTPTAEHPRPLILLHGFLANAADNMTALSPFFANLGYCVFTLNYGGTPGSIIGGLGDIRASSLDQFGPFVDQVLARTGASQVDVIGHSEGSMMPRWWMRYGPSVRADGTPKVHSYVGLTPISDGVDLGGLAKEMRASPLFQGILQGFAANGCMACEQIVGGSTLFEQLNTTTPQPGENFVGMVQPGVRYLMLATQWDNLVVPYWRGFIDDPAVTNMTVQDICPIDNADHLSVAFDPVAFDVMANFLDPDRDLEPRCVPTQPVFPPNYQGPHPNVPR